ncbi:glycosyltransferase family 4 protein [Thalassotalea euphylliae]|uniref:Glycosyltransferase n=1 Tax=Thalassotalea euphylliae TaxID=1655234 RepID=A0A3E0UAB5_9GAMM|nr:glycosyltransferase family 4 protein [Thalassotalea euphylliae]REL33981.1 glycosyltransferase [Thalassotalea euphylliae]
MQHNKIVFFDPCCPEPYSQESIKTGAIGGTESTALHISNALGVPLIQHNRTQVCGNCYPDMHFEQVDTLVVLRDAEKLYQLSLLYPKAKLFLWCHDLLYLGSDRAEKLVNALCDFTQQVTIVAVSEFHRQQIESTLAQAGLTQHSIIRIYNPLSPNIRKDRAKKTINGKWVFFSSPHKGLENALDAFEYIRKKRPHVRLYIANPGYQNVNTELPEGVINLGKLSPAEVYSHVQTAELVFYPNFVYPETFGIVFIEANYLGTPVLTHPIGAACEVLSQQNLNMRVPFLLRLVQSLQYRSELLAKLAKFFIPNAWQYTEYNKVIGNYFDQPRRDLVSMQSKFELKNIVSQWKRVLSGDFKQ